MARLMTLKRDSRYGRMQRTGRVAFILLFLFVLATLATTFHQHNDGSEHYDCPVCSVGHHYAAANVTVFSIANEQPVSSHNIPTLALLYDSIRVSLLPSRAPPA
jgi:hypothetical protein